MKKIIRTSLALLSIASLASIGLDSNANVEENINTVNLAALENETPDINTEAYSFANEITKTRLRVYYYEGTKDVDNMDIKFGGDFDARSIYDSKTTLTVDLLEQHLTDYTYGVAIFDSNDRNYVDQIGDEYEIKSDINMRKVLDDANYTYALDLNELVRNQFYKDPNASTKELKEVLPARVGMNWVIQDTLSIGYNFHFTAAMFKLDNKTNDCELASSKTHSTISATQAYLGGNQINDETRNLLDDFKQNYKVRYTIDDTLIRNNGIKGTYPEDKTNLKLCAFSWHDNNSGSWYVTNEDGTIDLPNYKNGVLFAYVANNENPNWDNLKYKTADLSIFDNYLELSYNFEFWTNDWSTSDYWGKSTKLIVFFTIGNKTVWRQATCIQENGSYGDKYKVNLPGYDTYDTIKIGRYTSDIDSPNSDNAIDLKFKEMTYLDFVNSGSKIYL